MDICTICTKRHVHVLTFKQIWANSSYCHCHYPDLKLTSSLSVRFTNPTRRRGAAENILSQVIHHTTSVFFACFVFLWDGFKKLNSFIFQMSLYVSINLSWFLFTRLTHVLYLRFLFIDPFYRVPFFASPGQEERLDWCQVAQLTW